MKSIIAGLLAYSFSGSLMAAGLLSPDEAFRYSARQSGDNVVEIEYKIAPGYYLYKDRLAFKADNPSAVIDEIAIPPAKTKFDPVFNKDVQYYDEVLRVRLRFKPFPSAFVLASQVQGCAEVARVCYMPTIHHFKVTR